MRGMYCVLDKLVCLLFRPRKQADKILQAYTSRKRHGCRVLLVLFFLVGKRLERTGRTISVPCVGNIIEKLVLVAASPRETPPVHAASRHHAAAAISCSTILVTVPGVRLRPDRIIM